MGNYIKIDRKILEWEWYKNLNTCRLFFHVLLKANWKDGRFQGEDIPRGSFVSSIAKLSEETGLTQREIRTALKHLKTTGELTVKSHSKYSVFTVNNYCLYQTNDTQGAIQGTNNRHSIDNQTTTIEERKEGEERKKERREEEKNIYSRVVKYLNAKCGTNYRCSTKSTIESIHARLADGFLEDDFYAVIDKKCAEWLGTKYEKYLRPQTLFRPSNFESYLNQGGYAKLEENQGEGEEQGEEEELIGDEWIDL